MEEEIEIDPRLYERAYSLERMLKSIRSSIRYYNFLHTAAELGWFSNGTLLTKLTNEEQELFKKLVVRDPQAKKYNLLPVKKMIDKYSGPPLTLIRSYPAEKEYPFTPSLVQMRSTYKDVLYLRTWEYSTLHYRHPKASFFMSAWRDATELPILVGRRMDGIMGLVMPYNMVFKR